jgi:hypothetical protein
MLHCLKGGHTDGASFQFRLDGTFNFVQAFLDLGSHAFLLRQFLKSEVINLEAEEGGVRREKGEEQLRSQVVDTTSTNALIGRVVLSAT